MLRPIYQLKHLPVGKFRNGNAKNEDFTVLFMFYIECNTAIIYHFLIDNDAEPQQLP